MMPKSTEPTDSRLADSPERYITMALKNSAKGMVAETTMALRRSPRKIHWMRNTRSTPTSRLCTTVWVVTEIRELRS